jgi:hypothetical protein
MKVLFDDIEHSARKYMSKRTWERTKHCSQNGEQQIPSNFAAQRIFGHFVYKQITQGKKS